jgi:hypothetical protein
MISERGRPRPWSAGTSEARRLPSPSAIMAVTRVLRLTPSCLALATKRACRLRGTRCRHWPLASLGFGIGSPWLAQLSRYDFDGIVPILDCFLRRISIRNAAR